MSNTRFSGKGAASVRFDFSGIDARNAEDVETLIEDMIVDAIERFTDDGVRLGVTQAFLTECRVDTSDFVVTVKVPVKATRADLIHEAVREALDEANLCERGVVFDSKMFTTDVREA